MLFSFLTVYFHLNLFYLFNLSEFMRGIERILTIYPLIKSVAIFHSHILWPSYFEIELEMVVKNFR